MFVLITGECEVISCETKVEVFATKEDAWTAMAMDAKARAWDAGIPEDEINDYVDSIGADGGYIQDVVGWQIRELPDMPSTEFDGGCPVCGGEVSCMLSDYDHEEYECDECGTTFTVGHAITSICKRED